MINETIERLRKEIERSDGDLWTFDVEDVSKVLAEIERLRGELSEAREYNGYYFDLCKERKREIERLRNAHEEIVMIGYVTEQINVPKAFSDVVEIARRATATEAIAND